MAVDPDVSTLKNSIMAEFPSVFQDTPSSIDSRATDAHHPAQRRSALSAIPGPCNPLQWCDAVEAQLLSMESKGVIEKVPVGVQGGVENVQYATTIKEKGGGAGGEEAHMRSAVQGLPQ